MPDLVTARPYRLRDEEGNVRVVAEIDGSQPLWFSVSSDDEALLGARADHVAVALLLPAMRHARDLRIGGVVTDSLLHRLNHRSPVARAHSAPELPLGRGDGRRDGAGR